MTRGGLRCAALLVFTPIALSLSQSAPRRIFGLYGVPQQDTQSAGSDQVRVTAAAKGRIALSIKLYFAGGHTCTLEKEGDWHGDRVLVVAEGLDANAPCRLQARFPAGRLVLHDEGQRCAQVYCGTRGKLDGVTLVKKHR